MKRYKITIRGGGRIVKGELIVRGVADAETAEAVAEELTQAIDSGAYVDSIEELA